MEKLWAPWRRSYVQGEDKVSECIFCDKPEKRDDREELILHRGKNAFVIMNLYPYNNGHVMVVPYRHVGEFTEMTDDEMLEIMQLCQLMIKVTRKVMNPDAFNTGFNLGGPAGAGIAEHLHMHLVPRWNGDTNFMPTIAGTKVISEHILDTYDKLKNMLLQETDQ